MAEPLPLLIVESGRFRMAVDATTVSLVSGDASPEDLRFTDVLGEAPRGKGRSVSVSEGGQDLKVIVDRVVQLEFVEPEVLQPLPQSIRRFGAPDWLLGRALIDSHWVWLVDLLRAARSQPDREP